MTKAHFNVATLMARNATLYRNREAVVGKDERYSYEQIYFFSAQLAGYLAREEISAGERIAILSDNEVHFFTVFFAAAHLGAITVPINTRLSEEETAYILRDTEPKWLIASQNYLERAKNLYSSSGVLDLESLFKMPGSEVPDRNLSPDTPCLIIHTAAVGGRPRGAVLTHENLISTAIQLAHLLKLTPGDCHLCMLPLYHIGGLAFSLATMLSGGKTVLMSRFDPEAVPESVEKEGVTFFITFPPMLKSILEVEEKKGKTLPSLRLAGGVDSPDTKSQFHRLNPQAQFYSIYGQTECMPICGGVTGGEGGMIGPPALLTQVSIRDEENQELPPGVVGEICVRSPSVFSGYWPLSDDSSYTFRGGWHHTGDLGEVNLDGILSYRGRKPEKDLIKTGGENVYPREVEGVILSQGAIAEVCVIGVPDEKWGESVVALCVLKQGSMATEGEIIDYVASRIARYKKPRHVFFLPSLPKTSSGSIDREEAKKIGVKLCVPPQRKG